MPAWIVSILINLVVKFGVPYVLSWLHKRFPNLPIPVEIKTVINDLADDLQEHREAKKDSIRDAKARLMKACTGVGCPPDLVKEE